MAGAAVVLVIAAAALTYESSCLRVGRRTMSSNGHTLATRGARKAAFIAQVGEASPYFTEGWCQEG